MEFITYLLPLLMITSTLAQKSPSKMCEDEFDTSVAYKANSNGCQLSCDFYYVDKNSLHIISSADSFSQTGHKEETIKIKNQGDVCRNEDDIEYTCNKNLDVFLQMEKINVNQYLMELKIL